MNPLRQTLVYQMQRVNRRFNTPYLEAAYQASYLDLARRTAWLEDVPLASPSGGTASFSQLYLLLSILSRSSVSRVLELGAGQSSSLFRQHARVHAGSVVHIDDDERWLERVASPTPEASSIHSPLRPMRVDGRSIRWYDCPQPSGPFDLVLVDGPPSWTRERRFDRLGILRWLPDVMAAESALVVDDSNRPGERRLVEQATLAFERAGRPVDRRDITGASSQTLLATPAFDEFLYL
jgi:predicted O-methyltransferase YrrM